MTTKQVKQAKLELDIDLRLLDIWREASEITEWTPELVAAFMRACYGKGYQDALTEGDRLSLYRDNGYRIPDGVLSYDD